jgi:hypothetical protein
MLCYDYNLINHWHYSKKSSEAKRNVKFFTFHDVDGISDIALLDDHTVFGKLDRMHALNYAFDVMLVQIFHEIVVVDGVLENFSDTIRFRKKIINYSYDKRIQKINL